MSIGLEGADEGMFGEEGYDDGGQADEYGEEGGEEGSEPIGEGGNLFEALAQNPNFALIRQRILTDPAFYQQFIT